MTRKLLVLVGLTTVWVMVFAGAAEARVRSAHTPPPACMAPGSVVEIGASVQLTADFGCSLDVVSADMTTPIVVDLGGHTLDGFILDDTNAPLYVRNGTVTGRVGPELRAPDSATKITIDHVHVMGDAGAVLGGDLIIRFSQIDGAVLVGGNNTAIHWSVVRGGISMTDTDNGLSLSITHNLIVGAPGAGIFVLDEFLRPDIGGTISSNTITRSTGSGIDLGLGTDLSGLQVDHNLLTLNGGDGITLGPSPFAVGGSVTLTGNTAIGNAGHGFNLQPTAPDTVTDGGHNRAAANHTAPACVGVAC
jgi:hypothetical protein